VRFLICDNDAKFGGAFDAVFRSEPDRVAILRATLQPDFVPDFSTVVETGERVVSPLDAAQCALVTQEVREGKRIEPWVPRLDLGEPPTVCLLDQEVLYALRRDRQDRPTGPRFRHSENAASA
jgi:hypothetical protein